MAKVRFELVEGFDPDEAVATIRKHDDCEVCAYLRATPNSSEEHNEMLVTAHIFAICEDWTSDSCGETPNTRVIHQLDELRQKAS